MSEYKDAITAAMTALGKEDDVVFVGYNLKYGGRGGGSLKDVPDDKIEEMPLAENLMAGVAIGLALDGKIPVVVFERFDFVLHALDAIVNHLEKLALLSDGLHKPACILRVIVGNSKTPLFTGVTHCQNYADAIGLMVGFPVIEMKYPAGFRFQEALVRARSGVSTMLVEFKDLY